MAVTPSEGPSGRCRRCKLNRLVKFQQERPACQENFLQSASTQRLNPQIFRLRAAPPLPLHFLFVSPVHFHTSHGVSFYSSAYLSHESKGRRNLLAARRMSMKLAESSDWKFIFNNPIQNGCQSQVPQPENTNIAATHSVLHIFS